MLKYFHIPGQDVILRWVGPEDGKALEGEHSTMAKCASDAARHYGRRRNANECFGCCGPDGVNWAFSADNMKWYMDWLFVRGANLLYPHAFYYSVNGELRHGERPPDVGPNNIWWKYYNRISDYIKRMSWLMTDSVNQASVAVLCEEDHLPWRIAKPLYENQIEFNYLEDNLLLSDRCSINDGHICIQKQKYNVLLIEDKEIFTDAMMKKLQDFFACGGKVIAYSKDGYLFNDCLIKINDFEKVVDQIRKTNCSDARICPKNEDLRMTHVIKNNLHFYVLVNEGEERIKGTLHISHIGKAQLWDAWKGSVNDIGVTLNDGCMTMDICVDIRESIILCIDPNDSPVITKHKYRRKSIDSIRLNQEFIVEGKNVKQIILKELKSWSDIEVLKKYCGTLSYSTTFNLDNITNRAAYKLDLGKVCEIAHIYINDRDVEVRMWAPYAIDITEYIRAGENKIKVYVSNSKAVKYEKRLFESGLIGPVTIMSERIEEI